MDLTKDRKKLKELYQPGRKDFTFVDVPALPFAMIDAEGPLDHGIGARATKALFTAIYPIRTEARKRMGKAFVDAPLEMLYWADEMRDLAMGKKENWNWRAMIVLPAWTDDEMFMSAVKKPRSIWLMFRNRCAWKLSRRVYAHKSCILERRMKSRLCLKGYIKNSCLKTP